MAIQDMIKDVAARVDRARKPYQDALNTYVDVQKKAFKVVTGGARTLARTEIQAAKDVFSAARSSFEKARTDGVRQVANQPQAYLPEGRDRLVSAYKDTLDLIVKTSNELTDVMADGYKKVLKSLNGKPAAKKKAPAKKPARKTAAKRASSTGTKTSTARKTTTSKAKSTGNGSAATSAS
ncbi:hypothetical protein [Spectribacter hydrogenoxidans]|uniref:Phasin family protein n=1 Tax=Spectribacter hydrogenoxidans TaxID=3075608 RepID=A0ABU3C108_9GAMM|nr:hypothetical protein [Salinisphaera sp. W335]MDT0635238.1 hypothetical protein [Salinisphaera sp. W335]